MIEIYCEICREKVAMADEATLVQPIRGSMFLSPDAWHGVPDPFAPTVDWEFMKCPWCLNRPFIDPTTVTIHVPGTEAPKVFERYEIPVLAVVEKEEIDPLVFDADMACPPVEEPKIEYYGNNPHWGEIMKETQSAVLTCDVCGKVIRGKGPMGAHMRKHRIEIDG